MRWWHCTALMSYAIPYCLERGSPIMPFVTTAILAYPDCGFARGSWRATRRSKERSYRRTGICGQHWTACKLSTEPWPISRQVCNLLKARSLFACISSFNCPQIMADFWHCNTCIFSHRKAGLPIIRMMTTCRTRGLGSSPPSRRQWNRSLQTSWLI